MTSDRRETATYLADEILTNIELRDISLSAVMLKCGRLARLLKDQDARQIFIYEAGGYPSNPSGTPSDAFELGRRAGRVFSEKQKDGSLIEKISVASVESLEQANEARKIALQASSDPNVSLSSVNPSQIVSAPMGNSIHRNDLLRIIAATARTLSASRAFAYDYVSSVQYELEFSSSAAAIFTNISERIDIALIERAPAAVKMTASINDNLSSENPEDWAHAVHGCRRLLQGVADALFPPRESETRNGRSVKLGADQYINRLVCFIEDHTSSDKFRKIVGSTLAYIGERLDGLFSAAQKGSHAALETREEAERYVIYTYMTLGDILSL